MTTKPDRLDEIEQWASDDAGSLLLREDVERVEWLIAEIKQLHKQVVKTAEHGEHWYQMWTERGAENERLQAALERDEAEIDQLQAVLTQIATDDDAGCNHYRLALQGLAGTARLQHLSFTHIRSEGDSR